MTRRAKRSAPLPAGAWRRFFAALTALVVVLVGVPALLVVCSRAGLGASHPFPAIGSTAEIKAYFQRDLTPTEVAPVAMRALLMVAWALWLGMVLSVLASIFEARGSALRAWVPQFAMFAGLGRWIAAGLTAVSALAPNFVSAAALASPRPFTISSVTPDRPVTAESPVQPGFARVQRGESIETFAQRLLGDAARWPELWELNKDQEVGIGGEVWTAPWKLSAGWDLRLPHDAARVTAAAAVGPATAPTIVVTTPVPSAWADRGQLTVVDEYEVVGGDSYWGIAERFLPDGSADREVWEFTQALMAHNAPRLGYAHPAMLHPGDVVAIVAPTTAGASDEAPTHTVVAGDSYWEIAEQTLGEEATAQDVLALTGELVDLNGPRLSYADSQMIHPGDVVYITDSATVDDDQSAGQVGPTAEETGERDVGGAPPAITAPATTLPPPTTTTSTSSTLPPPTTPDPPADADTVGPVARRRLRSGSGRPPSSPPESSRCWRRADGPSCVLPSRRRVSRSRVRMVRRPSGCCAASTRVSAYCVSISPCVPPPPNWLTATNESWSSAVHRTVRWRSTSTPRRRSPHRGVVPIVTGRWTPPFRWRISPPRRVRSALPASPSPRSASTRKTETSSSTSRRSACSPSMPIPSSADDIVRAFAVGLASSEFAEVAHLVGVGIDEEAFLGHRHAQVVPTVDEAIELAATLIGGTDSDDSIDVLAPCSPHGR